MASETLAGPRPRLCLFTRAWRASGAGLYASELARGLAAAGAETWFIAPHSSDDRLEAPLAGLNRLRQPHERPGASRPVNALRSMGRIAAGFLFCLRVRLSCRHFVYTIMDPLPFALLMIGLLRLSGAHVIYIAHDPVPHVWTLSGRWRALERFANRLLHRMASELVVLSEASKRTIIADLGAGHPPVTMIEHGIFVVGDPTPLPGSRTLLLFGTIRSNKGVLAAIEGMRVAAGSLDAPARLLIRGGAHRDEPDYLAQVRAAAEAAGALVDLAIGYVAEEDLRALLGRCDALLMPYQDFHSQSGVALLAASNGRPIIAAPAGGLADLIADGMPCAPIAQPVTGETVGEGIVTFFTRDLGEWSREAERYRADVVERLSWPRLAERFIALCR